MDNAEEIREMYKRLDEIHIGIEELKKAEKECKEGLESTNKKLLELDEKRIKTEKLLKEMKYEIAEDEYREKECKKKFSYKISIFILKILLFLLIIGFGMIAGIYYLIVALVISWIFGSIFIKL